MKNISDFEKELAKQMAESIARLGESAKDLDWYAGNLFPEKDVEQQAA